MSYNIDLSGRVALITGASSGLGQAQARHYHRAGWRLALIVRQPAKLQAWLDEQGRLFLDTDAGFGIVRSADMAVAVEAVEGGHWRPQDTRWADLPARFGFQPQPQPQPQAQPQPDTRPDATPGAPAAG